MPLVPATAIAFDLLLAAALLWSAIRAITTPDLFRSVVMFIVFGLLVALVWARLDAPDIALAEAAIGAGLTGALLLDAVGHLRAIQQAHEKDHKEQKKRAPGRDGDGARQ